MRVPVTDFNSPNAAKLFTQSLQDTGFAVLINHPIKKELVDGIYKEWQQFFASKEKFNYRFEEGHQDGYIPADISEKAKGYDVKDLKEFFNYYPWGKFPPYMSSAISQMYVQMTEVAAVLLQWIEKNTPKEVSEKFSMPLSKMIENTPNSLLRVIHYPPLQGNEENGAVRAAAHEDINLITLLPAATHTGLQVQDKAGQWYDVPCDYGSLIINTGDMLQECSGGYYKSTTHRVVNPEGELAKQARLSMPLFLHPRPEVRLSEKYTAESYLTERLKEIGLLK